MSEFIDIASLRDLRPPKVKAGLPVLKEPDTERLKKHFLAVFSRHTKANAFVIKSSAGHYRLRLDRSGILYTETVAGHTEEIQYSFESHHVLHNHELQPVLFLKKFMLRLREISGDVEANLATIYEEVLR